MLFACAVMLLAPRPASAEPIPGELSLNSSGGYLRLVLRFPKEVETQVRLSSSILVISFKEPVDVSVDRINLGATDYIGAARRDPDGRAIRLALARKVTVNATTAAEQVFIDLMPESWTGPPPALPREVVEELARRTREAERLNRQLQLKAQVRRPPPVRVRVTRQPTFIRYIFELPDLTGVSTDRTGDKLMLTFAAPLRFDLADVRLDLPPVVESIDAEPGNDAAKVSFTFSGSVDVRMFREDSSYIVDLTPLEPKSAQVDDKAKLEQAASPVPELVPPVVLPSKEGVQPAPAPPSATAVAPAPDIKAQSAPEKSAESAEPAVAPAEPAGKAAVEATADPREPVTPQLSRQGENLRIKFPFAASVPAAVFQLGDTVWLVFDTATPIDLAPLLDDSSGTVRSASITPAGEGQVLRLKLLRPRLVGLAAEGATWTVAIADSVSTLSRPLGIGRSVIGPARSSIIIPIDDPRRLHRLIDPDLGRTLLVVTAAAPARGFLKTHEFVELRALATTHGIAVETLADDLKVELSADKVVLSRPGGLALSNAGAVTRLTDKSHAVVFDTQRWGYDREANFAERQIDLIRAAAEAPPNRRIARRLDLARFYLANQMFVEAKAVLDVVIADERPTADDPTPLVLRAIANLMLNRTDATLKDLSNPAVGNQQDAQLWRALAYSRQGKWAQAREAFRNVEGAMATLPIELQLVALREALRAALEIGDLATAARRLNDIEALGVPPALEASVAVLMGRLAEGLGRKEEALAAYQTAAQSADRPAAAQGRLRELMLRHALGAAKKAEVIAGLEALTATWRGDDTEVEALQYLAEFYTEEGRYRDAFNMMRTALIADPNSDITRRIQDRAIATFDELFLLGKGDSMPAIDALSLFYDFRDLVPIGRRGDEMIRRLADRLVAVDLLEQAAELLQHQVDHRLQGAARAQVATKLAIIYLQNRKPDRAQAALRATRSADLSNELRLQRILLEARAISDMGRHDLALEVIENIEGREATRLRSDILWAARRWQRAAEQIELLHGDRWKEFEPLSDVERVDILRAAIGYALEGDFIGIARLKEKYAAKMAQGPDRRAFEVATGGYGNASAEFRAVVQSVASVDLLENFLRDLRARYPELRPAEAPDGAQPGAGPGQGGKPPA
ncbi:MAG TPA: tetratricopeptide repeat protein [Xanthobacteraceae bacterium]|nr:tetratricopeptide repeat protein [Xanthobacteraceae bacterium]